MNPVIESLGDKVMQSENGWDQYSKLVLKELETLTKGMDTLREELQGLKQEIAELKAQQDKVSELSQWKQRIDDVASPVQFKEMQTSIEELKLFKTKATTIFLVVQAAFGMLLALMKYFE
jgi:uncharacterized protein YoxC